MERIANGGSPPTEFCGPTSLPTTGGRCKSERPEHGRKETTAGERGSTPMGRIRADSEGDGRMILRQNDSANRMSLATMLLEAVRRGTDRKIDDKKMDEQNWNCWRRFSVLKPPERRPDGWTSRGRVVKENFSPSNL
jgi:hypothetical protein